MVLWLTVAALLGLFVGSTLTYYDVASGMSMNQTQPLCTKILCEGQDFGQSLQVVFTPGWNCPDTTSADCLSASQHNITALMITACKYLGLSESICLKGLHSLMLHQEPVPCPDLQGAARYDWKCCNSYDGAYDPNCDN